MALNQTAALLAQHWRGVLYDAKADTNSARENSCTTGLGCSQVGGYLRVLLHGRRQRQMEDMEYYLAIR